MASKPKAASSSTPSYVEFEPFYERQEEGGVETLIVHLQDFKKDQLRVQVNNQGVLKVSGDRPITGDGTRSRFLKETKIPQGCNIKDIRAKFVNKRLHIVMPKTVPTAPKAEEQLSSTTSTVQQDKKLEDTKKHTFNPSAENGEMETKTSYHEQTKDHMFGLGSSLERLQYGKKVAVSFGIAMVTMVAIGAYFAYKCGSNPSSSCIEDFGLK